jgi:hypothetical protein
MYIRMPRLLSVLVVSAIGLAGAAVAAAPAQAASQPWVIDTASRAATAKEGRLISVRLGLDCSKLSGKARTYAAEHDICPTGPSANTVTEGNCGKAWLFVVDDIAGDRVGRINFGATSVLGTIVWRNFYVSWAYTPLGAGIPPETGVIPDVGPTFGSTYDVSYVRGGLLGSVGAQLGGNAVLVWGAVCHILGPPFPSDFRAVT